MLTGINELATRSDLVDRALLVSLPTIAEEARITESEFWVRFDLVWPKLFGALLSALSTAMQRLPNTRLRPLPRMADFALFATAAEKALGLRKPFIESYAANRSTANDLALEASAVAKYIIDLMESRDTWEGTASELLAEINGNAAGSDQRLTGWPKTASKLSTDIQRVAPNLRRIGIDVHVRRTGRARSVRLSRLTPGNAVTGVTPVTPDARSDAGDGDDAESRVQSCDHINPASWEHRDGGAFCGACEKFIGKVAS